jgi:hypothetical protein
MDTSPLSRRLLRVSKAHRLLHGINGNRFYVSFIDAYSRYTWFYPIQAKFDVMPTFLQFQTMVERLLNSKIISVQSDWGGEYRTLH